MIFYRAHMLHLFNWVYMLQTLIRKIFEIPACFWNVPGIISILIRNELTSMEIAQSNTFIWTYFCFFHASILRRKLLSWSNNVDFRRVYIELYLCQLF